MHTQLKSNAATAGLKMMRPREPVVWLMVSLEIWGILSQQVSNFKIFRAIIFSEGVIRGNP